MRGLRIRWSVVVVVAVATRVVGCGSTIAASDYDQSCKVDSDCVAVGVGDPCGTPCDTFPAFDVISRTAYQRYRYDAVTAQESCSHCGTIQGCSGATQTTTSAYCVNDKCTLCNSVNVCDCMKDDPSCADAGNDGATGEGGMGGDGGDGGGTDAVSDAPEDTPQDAPGDAVQDVEAPDGGG